MAQSLYARMAARGFPVANVGGQSGQGALQDSTALPPSAGLADATWTDPNVDPASVGATLAAPQDYVLVPGMWGLPAMADPDNTPRTHAAPFTDPALLALGDDGGTHGPVFDGVAVRNDIGTLARFPMAQQTALGGSASPQQPLYKQPLSSNAGLDAVQGYGGGADGPGGVNASMPIVTDNRDYPGETYVTFVSAAEVPLIVPEADQFIATDPSVAPWQGGGYGAPTASVSAQETVTADTPAQGPALASATPVYATSFWG